MPIKDAIAEDASHVPAVTSPYEGAQISVSQHLRLSAYWFATNLLWGAMLVIVLPAEMKRLVPFNRVEAIGLMSGLAAIVALLVPLIVGELSDRCASRFGRRRPYIAVGVTINLVGLALMYLVSHTATPLGPSETGKSDGFWHTAQFLLSSPMYLLFLGAFMVVQLGNNIASAAYSGVIPDLVPADQRGAASGYMALMSQFGTLAGVVGCGLALSGQPIALKYLAMGIGMALLAMMTIFGIKENPLPRPADKINWGLYFRSLWIDPKLYPDFAWVWITRALVMLGFYSVLPFVNFYFVDVIGLENPDKPASMMTGLLLITSCISGIYGGILSDRIGRKKVVYIANMLIALMALSFIFCRTTWQVLIAGSIFGLGYGAYISVDWALGTDVLPSKKSAGKEMGVWHIAMTLPQTIASPLASELILFYGHSSYITPDGVKSVHYTMSGYAAIFVLCAVCFSLGAFFLKNVRSVN